MTSSSAYVVATKGNIIFLEIQVLHSVTWFCFLFKQICYLFVTKLARKSWYCKSGRSRIFF